MLVRSSKYPNCPFTRALLTVLRPLHHICPLKSGPKRLVAHWGVDHRGRDVGVTEKALHEPDAPAAGPWVNPRTWFGRGRMMTV